MPILVIPGANSPSAENQRGGRERETRRGRLLESEKHRDTTGGREREERATEEARGDVHHIAAAAGLQST